MPEKADTDNNVPRQRQPLLRLQELLLEARAAAEGYDGVFVDHDLEILFYVLKQVGETRMWQVKSPTRCHIHTVLKKVSQTHARRVCFPN